MLSPPSFAFTPLPPRYAASTLPPYCSFAISLFRLRRVHDFALKDYSDVRPRYSSASALIFEFAAFRLVQSHIAPRLCAIFAQMRRQRLIVEALPRRCGSQSRRCAAAADAQRRLPPPL